MTDRLRKIDDGIRKQYDVEKREHLKLVEKTKAEYELKVKACNEKVEAIEQEMRSVLMETEQKKRSYEKKIRSFSDAFKNIQADFSIG